MTLPVRPDKGDPRAELRASWPPAGAPEGRFLDACALPSREAGAPGRVAVAVVETPEGHVASFALVRADGASPWQVAGPSDGPSATLVEALLDRAVHVDGRFVLERLDHGAAGRLRPGAGSEQPITADQTNASVVVDAATVVKWMRRPSAGDDRAPRLLEHLALVGFDRVPAPVGLLRWQSEHGDVPLALVDRYLPGAQDGWTWCPDAVLEHVRSHEARCPSGCPAAFGPALGALTAELHLALATASEVIPAPVHAVDRDEVRGWFDVADALLRRVLSLVDGADGDFLRRIAPRLRAGLLPLTAVPGATVMPVHGDLHVGQVLQWSGGLAVIDFDGNPLLPRDTRLAHHPAARDVAQMLCSIDHVGRVANRRTEQAFAPAVARWITGTAVDLLSAYLDTLHRAGRSDLFDSRLLHPFMLEQQCRELLYAAEVLPRWRYAPMASLRALFPTSEETP